MPEQSELPKPPALTPEMRSRLLRATAIKQAMLEVFDLHREEIAKRARAKLKAFGIEVRDDEINPQL